MSDLKWDIIQIALWNVGLIILSGFCCWHFNTMWGLIPLFFVKTVESKNKDTKKEDEVNVN